MASKRENFLRFIAQTSEFPLSLEIVKGEGIYLYDTKGKKYFDLISGLAVNNIGHRHPKVMEAVNNQLLLNQFYHALLAFFLLWL